MRISVRCRGEKPHRLCIGQSRLPVTSIIERHADGTVDVRVLDGRIFAIRQNRDAGSWDLAAVYGRNGPPTVPALAPEGSAPAQAVMSLLHAAWVLLWRLLHLRISV